MAAIGSTGIGYSSGASRNRLATGDWGDAEEEANHASSHSLPMTAINAVVDGDGDANGQNTEANAAGTAVKIVQPGRSKGLGLYEAAPGKEMSVWMQDAHFYLKRIPFVNFLYSIVDDVPPR